MAGQLAGSRRGGTGTKRVLNMHLSQALSGAVQAGFAAEEVTMQSDEHRRMAALRLREE